MDMKTGSLIAFLLFLILHSSILFGQSTYPEFALQSQRQIETGMYILGGWALGNMAVGALGWKRNTGTTMYFHQMNVFWNVANLGIVTYSFLGNTGFDPAILNADEIMSGHERFQKIFLVNAGLDILYISGGLVLRRLSISAQRRSEMLSGYGRSLILQGSFLFLFDGAMFLLQHRLKSVFLEGLQFSYSGSSVLFGYRFDI